MKQKTKNIACITASIAMPVVVLLIVYAIIGFYPFGDKSILTDDMQRQYTCFLNFFKESIKQDPSNLLYSFQKPNGNMISLVGYYVLSPLNFIFLLANEVTIFDWIMVVELIKIGLSGLTSFLFFRSHVRKRQETRRIIFNLINYVCFKCLPNGLYG